MSKHTQGPWALLPEECDKPYIRIRGTALGGRYKIANVLTPVYENVHSREAEETRANARLIVAAPELLEALTKLLDQFDSEIHNEYDGTSMLESRLAEVNHAREIIAKATGVTK